MKVLGVVQFHQKTFKYLDLAKHILAKLLGKLPKFFIAVIFGFSGNGKTEFCIQLAKLLTRFGKVAWLSYEQRHSSDLQDATIRNNMDEHSGNFFVIDPIANKPKDVSLLEDLDNYLSKRNSPQFIFIDSIDYTRFTWDDYEFLKNKYAGKKSFIFIAHSTKSGILKKRISEQILFDGGLGLFVSNFICYPQKNRYGGFEPYVVFEEEARKRNPAFFAKRVQESSSPKSIGKSSKKTVKNKGVTEK